jgi:hypothetical protein
MLRLEIPQKSWIVQMDYLIAGIVAVAVFILLGRALPNRALYRHRRGEFEQPGQMPHSAMSATRLSRVGASVVSLGLVVVFGALLWFVPSLDIFVALAVVAISLWATADSYKIGLRGYQTRIALHPIALFNAMMFLWPVFFPWYLIIGSKIGDGTLPRKSDPIDSGGYRR